MILDEFGRSLSMSQFANARGAGLAAAANLCRKGGRKPVVTSERLKRASALIESGLTAREAAARLKVGKTALDGTVRSACCRPCSSTMVSLLIVSRPELHATRPAELRPHSRPPASYIVLCN